MGELLVLIDHDGEKPKKVSVQMLTKARELAEAAGDTVSAIWLGSGAAGAAATLGNFGAAKVYSWASEDAHGYVTLTQVEALQNVFESSGATNLLFASANFVKDVAARLAVRLDAAVITDVSDLASEDGRLVATKDVFGGSLSTTSQVRGDRKGLFGVKPNAFSAAESGGGAPEVVELDITPSDDAKKSKVVEVVAQASEGRPDVAEASIVVAGGRGLGEESGFRIIEQLADELGAAVGASRAATDAGWYPHRYQIGQTGRTISPALYLGAGISGAIQHRAGMQTSQIITCINKDSDAPIFQIADFGIVGDLYKVVPKLIEEIKARKA